MRTLRGPLGPVLTGWLALASAVVQAVDTNKGKGPIDQYGTGLWCCVGFAVVGLVASTFGVKNVEHDSEEPVMTH